MNDLLQSEGCLDEDSGQQEDQLEEQIMQHTIAISKKHSTSSSFQPHSSIDNHTAICNQGSNSKLYISQTFAVHLSLMVFVTSITITTAILIPFSHAVKKYHGAKRTWQQDRAGYF